MNLTDDYLLAIVKTCNRIQELILEGCALISDYGILCVAQHCLKLTLLNLSFTGGITEKALLNLSHNCRNLRTLELGKCRNIGGETDYFDRFVKQCNSVEELNLDNTTIDDYVLSKIGN